MTVAVPSLCRITQAVLLVGLLALVGCGKPGSTIAPAGSPYPRFYPNPAGTLPPKPDDATTVAPEQTPGAKPAMTKNGSYIDPSVRATELAAPSLPIGSNLPYARQESDSPLNQGLGAPTQSPLPQIDSLRPQPDDAGDATKDLPGGAAGSSTGGDDAPPSPPPSDTTDPGKSPP